MLNTVDFYGIQHFFKLMFLIYTEYINKEKIKFKKKGKEKR